MHELQGALCVIAQDVKAHEPLPRRNGEDGDLRPFERRDGYLLFLDARQRAADRRDGRKAYAEIPFYCAEIPSK